MDQMVLGTQKWLNKTYKGRISALSEDGITGWGTIRALTKALQLELGVSADGLWGPGTESKCPTISSNSGNKNIITILQCGLFCKGYDGGGIDGNYTGRTSSGISNLKRDAGLSDTSGSATPLIFKVLLSTMDGFVLASSGDSNIRKVQQNLNRDYYKIIGLIPCNGVYSRETNRALIKALQFEVGSTPDGIWGPGTQGKCPTIPGSRSNKQFVLLLQYCLYVNGVDPHGFDGLFGNGLSNAIKEFQAFCALPADGYAGKQVWASLLVSTGDSNRKGTVCDCSTTLTEEKIQTLKNSGYKAVGRYLTGKFKLTPTETKLINSNGLKLIAILEELGYELSHFNYDNGYKDGIDAFNAAQFLGFPKNTIIYFAVDCDVMDYQVTNQILPYFKGVNAAFNNIGSNYRIGIYAPRNVCSRAAKAGYTCSSFVCDMSTGFSGNLGYPLPKDWAFDQIKTITIGSGSGAIEIDNNIAKGNYYGESNINTTFENIFDKINNTNLCKLIGLEVKAFEQKKTIFNSTLIKLEGSVALGYKRGNGFSTIKINPNGTLEGIGITATLSAIESLIGPEKTVALTASIAELSVRTGTVELAYSVSSNAEGFKCELQIPVKVFLDNEHNNSITGTISLTFTIKKDGPKDALDATAEQAKAFGGEYGGLVFLAIIVLGVTLTAVEVGLTATGAVLAGLLIAIVKVLPSV
ncbi:glycoside hydrolase domain-containing protein [Clostridium botulinum]|uniref:glycoside hydrolase domain-containing protein n=1 Tax=Clostridium botulinum TaxID=1491 RepID=UPI000D11C202|nr:glycoside hydrolase domain-containing protein [Clostridium botulinum]AVQ47647.1 peptidoglycan-binding protein [Clostridium botulinum]AVQ51196.1 peptidoglycan-binding protein [Clostridium botulinum]